MPPPVEHWIIIGQEWATWKLIPGWNKEGRDIGWAECILDVS